VDERGAARGERSGDDDYPGTGSVSWGPTRWFCALSLALMVIALIWHFLAHDPEDRLVAAAFALVAALATLALVRLRVRLTAGPRGIVVREMMSTRRIDWADIRSASLPVRGRMGVNNQALEIDLRDDSLYVFGRFDLGVPPAEVRRELVRQRGSALPGSTGATS
jgi:Bacterial PH domain